MDNEDWENRLYDETKRSFRKERKKTQARDRSKYKKSDQKEPTQVLHAEGTIKGQILSILPEGFLIESQGAIYTASLRGVLKKERHRNKNLAVIGDFVQFETQKEGAAAIVSVLPRRSELSRQDNLSRKKRQLIAANVDQLLITASVCHPRLRPPLIDRYLIAAEKGGLKPLLMINKIDLLQEMDDPLLAPFLEGWKGSVDIFLVSLKTGEGIARLKEALQGKETVLSGQSGVGKTSLINSLCDLHLKTREIVEKTKKGAHTTSFATLIPLPSGGSLIDTPGIKSFGVWELEEEEIRHYFSNFEVLAKECKFLDCTHTHEIDCKVLKAVEENKLSLLRYESYISLLASVREKHLKR